MFVQNVIQIVKPVIQLQQIVYHVMMELISTIINAKILVQILCMQLKIRTDKISVVSVIAQSAYGVKLPRPSALNVIPLRLFSKRVALQFQIVL